MVHRCPCIHQCPHHLHVTSNTCHQQRSIAFVLFEDTSTHSSHSGSRLRDRHGSRLRDRHLSIQPSEFTLHSPQSARSQSPTSHPSRRPAQLVLTRVTDDQHALSSNIHRLGRLGPPQPSSPTVPAQPPNVHLGWPGGAGSIHSPRGVHVHTAKQDIWMGGWVDGWMGAWEGARQLAEPMGNKHRTRAHTGQQTRTKQKMARHYSGKWQH
jgi:hypothetical protein